MAAKRALLRRGKVITVEQLQSALEERRSEDSE